MSSTEEARARAGDPVLASAAIRRVEAQFAHVDLMRRAGKAAADFLVARSQRSERIVLFSGPGNNGGDALACATELAGMGYAPVVVVLGDVNKFAPDAAQAWSRAQERCRPHSPRPGSDSDHPPLPNHPPSAARGQITVLRELPRELTADWIVDGLFGIGLKRPLDAVYRDATRAIAQARQNGAKVLALDVPSGIDADTGALVGEVAVAADHTLTFIARKPALMTGPALDYVGQLHLESLGLDLGDVPSTITTFGLNDALLRMRPARANAHKGSNGTLTIVGGANGMLGAALLASRAAMRMGAGKVKVAWLAEPHPQVDPQMPEVMMRAAADESAYADASALVVGCGMGQSAGAKRVLAAMLRRTGPLLLDADALNLIAQSKTLQNQVTRREGGTVITPHPTEAARLLGISTAAVQHDRLRAARELATRFNCVAVVKGAGTVVDDGHSATINTTGNPLLATAGTGDVLAGMIGALLAQGYSAGDAARIGVALHGAAADALAARGVKRAVAGDVVTELTTL